MNEQRTQLGVFRLSTPGVRVGDVALIFNDFVDVNLPPGEYHVESHLAQEQHDDVLSLRVSRGYGVPMSQSTTVPITFAQVGIFPASSLSFLQAATEQELDHWQASFDRIDDQGMAEPCPDATVPFMRTATGYVTISPLGQHGVLTGILVKESYPE
jgi:hypothetical protein